jgi:hypothetical protein
LLGSTGQVWQLTAANTIRRRTDLGFSGNSFTNSLPPQSITFLILPAGTVPPPQLRAGSMGAGNTFDFWLDGVAGQKYVIQSTVDFLNWASIQTNTLTSSSWHVILPASTGTEKFYRGQWQP